MKAACTSCGKPFLFDDSRFGDRESVKVRCPACKSVVTLERPSTERVATPGPSATPATARPASSSPTQKFRRDEVIEGTDGQEILLPMPRDRRISLAILSGKGSGKVIPCERSRVVIGRSGADVVIDDDEVSRRHAAIEIREDRYFLKDLGSTNGTFVDERKISETEIADKGEFRIGTTQIMLIVTSTEEV